MASGSGVGIESKNTAAARREGAHGVRERRVGEAHGVDKRHGVASHDGGAVGIDSGAVDGVGGRHGSGEQHGLSVDGVCESELPIWARRHISTHL